VIRRVTCQRPGEFFAEQLAWPLAADFHIGLPLSESRRVAELVPWPPHPTYPADLDPDGPAYKTFTGPTVDPDVGFCRTERWRRAEIPAANGHGNARPVARIQSAVACVGEVGGVRLLSPGTVDRIFEVQSYGVNLVLGIRLRIGVGTVCPGSSPDLAIQWRYSVYCPKIYER
jgi:hypothetical protein